MRPASLLLALIFSAAPLPAAFPEALSRGVVAVHQPDGSVFVSWRLLASDPSDARFEVLRTTAPRGGGAPDHGRYASRPDPEDGSLVVASIDATAPTWTVDRTADLSRDTTYLVRLAPGPDTAVPSPGFRLPAGAEPLPFHRIPLQTPPGYTAGDASAADLDGDGAYEIVLKQELNPQDNSRPGRNGPALLQAYRMDGTLLWTINLGINIREGAHYTQFMVYDLDGDGRAEVACKTADGTADASGAVIGDASVDHRDARGHVLTGPEFLTVFDGPTGRIRDTVRYVPGRHPDTENPSPDQLKAVWGDGHGNRSDRYLACVAYLDGVRPSLVMCRGYYTRAVLAAWDFREGRLAQRWIFDSDDGTPGNAAYRGQGNHNLSVADVDGDGRDEIVYGAAVIDDDGRGLYATGWGHGDALHVSDLDPSNPGLEVFSIQERFAAEGMNLRDAATGRALATVPSVRADAAGGDKGEGPGRGVAADIDPRFPGAELWASGAGMDGLHDSRGRVILAKRPRGFPANFVVWWDGDFQRELLDRNFVVKWNPASESLDPLLTAHGCVANNGTKATPALSADLWGDWREEIVWRTPDSRELRIYTSTIPTPHRRVTWMHDRTYRLAVAWQNVAYNQPPHPSVNPAVDATR